MKPSSQKTERSSKPTSKSWLKGMGSARRYVSLGLQAGVAVAFYLGAGLLLDKWLNTLPWLTLLGALVGIVAMFALFYRVNKELNRQHDRDIATRTYNTTKDPYSEYDT